MHEKPYGRHLDVMGLMRKSLIRYGLLPALALGGWCGPVRASARPPIACVVPVAQTQRSGQAPAANDSDGQTVPGEEGLSLSDQIVRDVMEPLRLGMEAQNLQLVLSVFDKKELTGYSDLQGQLRVFFHQYDEVRFRYRILQVTADKGQGSATAELEMDALPYELTQVPSRRSVQMRFQLKLEPKGWKVTGFSPAGFFAVDYVSK